MSVAPPRFARALVVAAVLHAVTALLLGRLRAAGANVPTGSQEGLAGELAIDTQVDEPVAVAAVLPTKAGGMPVPAARTPIPELRARADSSRTEGAGEVAGEGDDTVTASDGTWTGWANKTASIDLGLDGGARWSLHSKASVTGSTTGGLVEALDALDRAHSQDAGGELTKAAVEATRASVAPVRGEASIEVVLDGSGRVTRARVLSASSDARAWDEVAEAIQAKLIGRPLRIPPASHGLAFTIAIESRFMVASGHDGQVETSVNGIPVSGRGARNPVRLGLMLTPGIVAIGSTADPTDLAWKTQRNVTARVTHEQRF